MSENFESFLKNLKHTFPGLTVYAMPEEMGLDAAGAPCGLRMMARFEEDGPLCAFTVLSEEAAINVIRTFTLAGMDRAGQIAREALRS